MSDPNIPDYKTTPKCSERGLDCNGKALKVLADGRRMLVCTQCGRFSDQIYEDPKKCQCPDFYVNTVQKEGKNKGRQFRKCKFCNKFEWIDAQGNVVDNEGNIKPQIKKRKLDGASQNDDVATLQRTVSELEKSLSAMQMQLLQLDQRFEKLQSGGQ